MKTDDPGDCAKLYWHRDGSGIVAFYGKASRTCDSLRPWGDRELAEEAKRWAKAHGVNTVPAVVVGKLADGIRAAHGAPASAPSRRPRFPAR